MKELTKEQWQEFVSKNCDNSYSLVVCLCIINIWEEQAKTSGQAHDTLQRAHLGITGAQADMAIEYALSHSVNWPIGKDAFFNLK